jgi:hypothetical protein
VSAGFGQWRGGRGRGRGSSIGLPGIASVGAHHQVPRKHRAEDQRAGDDHEQAQPGARPVADRVVHAVAPTIGRVEQVDAQHDAANAGDDNGRNSYVAQSPHGDLEGTRSAPAVDVEVLNAEEVAVFLRVDRKTVYDYASRGQTAGIKVVVA